MRRVLGMFVALIALCVGIGVSNEAFFSSSNVFNTNRQIAMLGIFAVGVSFVIATGGIDLSIGSIIGLTGVLIAHISSPTSKDGWQQSYWVGIPIAIGVALLIGLAQGLLITRLNLQPFIVTLGGMLLIRGVSQVITGGGSLGFGSNSPFRRLASEGLINRTGTITNAQGQLVQITLPPLLPYIVIIFLVIFVLATLLLHFTVFGRYIFAIGGNRDAAEYSGIPVKRVETLTYVISAGLAGVAGVCSAAYVGQMTHNQGVGYELSAIAAAVIGGVSLRGGEGTVLGIVIGSALLRVIYNGINLFKITYTDKAGEEQRWSLSSNWEFVVIGTVILLAVILDQIVHIFQARRRTRKAGAAAPPAAGQQATPQTG